MLAGHLYMYVSGAKYCIDHFHVVTVCRREGDLHELGLPRDKSSFVPEGDARMRFPQPKVKLVLNYNRDSQSKVVT